MKIKLSSIFLFVVASAVMGSGIGYSKLYLFHVALIIFIVAFSLFCFGSGTQHTLSKPRNIYLYFLYLMFLWYALSIVWSINYLYTLRYLFYLLIGITIVFLVNAYADSKEKYISVFNVLSFVFILAMGIAILESFTPFRLPTSPYSSYASYFGRNATDFSDFDISTQALILSMPTSFWGNPNNLAVAMSIVAPFFMFHSKLAIKIIGLSFIVLIITMTGSRGSFIALLWGGGYFCLFVVFCIYFRYWSYWSLFFLGLFCLKLILTILRR